MLGFSPLDRRKGLRLPQKSASLAEIVGIHFGDGTMENGMKSTSATYKVAYALDARRPEYVDFVKRIFQQTFRIPLHQLEERDRHCTRLYAYSKSICVFLHDLGIPYGKKRSLHIPGWIAIHDKYLAAFLRGLFDTDGCYVTQKQGTYSYRLLKFTMKSREFAEEIKRSLVHLGMKAYICNKGDAYDVVIRDRDSYNTFMMTVRPRKEKMGVLRFELRSVAIA